MNNDKLKRVPLKEEMVELTGSYKKALILQQLIYWSERIDDFDKFLEEENNRKDRDEEIEKREGWMFKSASELSEETMLGFSESTMRRHIKDLIAQGWVDERENPKYRWDKTKQYRVNINAIRGDLRRMGYTLEEYPDYKRTSNLEDRSSESKDRKNENERAIPETTTETTNREKDIDDSEQKDLQEIFDHWVNQESTVSHRKFKDAYKSAIRARLKDEFTVDEIKQAITNYDKNNRADNTYWSYDAWSLKQFLSRDSGSHVETFLEKPKTYIEDGSSEFKFTSDEDSNYDEDWGFRPED